mgnify:CR=1 FL=1
MRLVLDTNVLISASLWSASVSQKMLSKLILQNAEVYSSLEILSEFQKVLKRDFNYSESEVTVITEKLFSFLLIANPTEKIVVVTEDPDDDKILECALAVQASHIVSYDRHLLKIKEFRGIKILKPDELQL